MRFCGRCRRRFYEEGSYCPFDGGLLEAPDASQAAAWPATAPAPAEPAPAPAEPAPAPAEPAPAPAEPAPAAAEPLPGSTLGQIRLIEPIGSGAMGTVYRAWQAGMEREVAVKLLRADLAGDPQLRRRFLREARAAARLAHPNIVCVHLVGETESGSPYLVMEHLDGTSLEDVLEQEGALPPGRALAIARQIASALAEAHAGGVVHRDLKPANVVLVERRGVGELVKILDFGIAKLAGGALLAGDASRLTRTGTVFGTPHYIAPEQAQGAAVDGRADLYSLGVLLYRMLSGRLPFDGSAVAVLLAHISRPPPELSELAPQIDPRLAALVMRCLAKQPGARPASAEELAAALDEIERAAGDERTSSAGTSAPRAVRAPAVVVSPSVVPWGATELSAAASPPRSAAIAARRAAGRRGAARGRLAASLGALALVATLAGSGAIVRESDLLSAGAPAEAAEATGAPPRLAPKSAGPDIAAEPTDIELAALRAPGPRRSVIVTEAGYSVRALIPESLIAGDLAEILLDVWGPDGEPLEAPFIEIDGGPAGPEPAPALSGQPGRYRFVGRFSAGRTALHVDLPAGGMLHLHLEVAPSGQVVASAR